MKTQGEVVQHQQQASENTQPTEATHKTREPQPRKRKLTQFPQNKIVDIKKDQLFVRDITAKDNRYVKTKKRPPNKNTTPHANDEQNSTDKQKSKDKANSMDNDNCTDDETQSDTNQTRQKGISRLTNRKFTLKTLFLIKCSI